MKPINNWDNVTPYSGGSAEKLPAGGYVGKIIGAKIAEYNGRDGKFEKLEIALDVNDGPFIDYFKNQFESSTLADKKWKGVYRLNVPTQDGSDTDNFRQRLLKSAINAIEDSNAKYKWDWDESKLKGKKIGFLVRDKEYEFNGKHGFYPEIFALIPVQDAAEGKFEIPKPKLLDGSKAGNDVPPPSDADAPAPSDDNYPF